MKPFIPIVFLLLLCTSFSNAQEAILAKKKAIAFMENHFMNQAAFKENKGQVWDTQGKTATYVKYHYQHKNIDIFMLSTGIAYQFTKVHYPEGYKASSKDPLSQEEQSVQKKLQEKIRTETYRMDMELINANPNPTIIAEEKSKDYVQYYNRNALDVYSFKKLTYQAVYPGIDWVIYSTEKGLKYDFVVQPGADPSQIQLKFSHHEDLKINKDGSFTLSSFMGSITEQAPVSFQEEQDISTAFKLDGDILSFDLSNYDKTKLLTIDPNLIWASYYGGTYTEIGFSCAVDGAGNVYLAGETESSSNIASGGHQNTTGIYKDAFLAKFNSAGVRLWATYYGGGTGGNTRGLACAVDGVGNVFLSGDTDSGVNIASGGHQNNYGGGFGNYEDAFLVKFNSAGVRLWATYYGGTGADSGFSCAVDGAGNVFLAGRTNSSSNIAFGSNTFTGGAFIAKFNSAGTRLWATYYGGNNNTEGNSCAVDVMGNVYLTGWTASTSSVASNGHQTTYGGGNSDAFIVKFDSIGNRLWATYYGGALADQGRACTVDAAGNLFLAGWTASTSGIASNGHQTTYGGGNSDAFIVKFDSSGSRLWATYYGGTSADEGKSCVVDGAGNVFLAGWTGSTSNIASGGHQNTHGGYLDAFTVKFDDTGGQLWATYYGMSDSDIAYSCAVDGTGHVYLVGETESSSGIASGGHQNTYGGFYDAFIVKLAGNNCPTSTGTDTQTACDSFTWINGNTYITNNNSATHILTNAAGCDSIVTLNLTILSSTGTDTQTACDSFTWINGNTYTTNNNSATHILTNAAGCDSIVTLNLTILNSSTGTDTQTACDSFTWINGNTYTTNNNSATYILTNAAGCDSIVTLNLTILNSSTGTDIQTACGSFTWIDGQTYTSNNNSATHTLTNGAGCDSIVTLNLTIYTIDTSLSIAQTSITANATGANYQWLDCDSNYSPISGATAATFTALNNGNYAVEISQNGCIDTSSCVQIIGVGTTRIPTLFNKVSIYPNPTNGLITVDLGDLKEGQIKVVGVNGQIIHQQKKIPNNIYQFDLKAPIGIYFIEIGSQGQQMQYKIIKYQ